MPLLPHLQDRFGILTSSFRMCDFFIYIFCVDDQDIGLSIFHIIFILVYAETFLVYS